VAENPPGILSAQIFKGDERHWPKGEFFGEIVREITTLGYCVGWGVWGACDVGAPHKRERIFIVAYNNSIGFQETWAEQPTTGIAGSDSSMADSESANRKSAEYTRGRRSGFTDSGIVENTWSGGRREARGLCDIRGIQGEDRQGRSDQPLASGEVPGVVADSDSYCAGIDLPAGRSTDREVIISSGSGTSYGTLGNTEHDGLPSGTNGRADGEDVCQCQEREKRSFEPSGTNTPGMLSGKLGDTNSAGCEECDPAAISGNEGFSAGECTRGDMGDAGCIRQCGISRREYGEKLEDGHICGGFGTQSGMDRDAYGTAFRLDFPCWPAGRGAEQHLWEPPRVVPSGEVPERPARIKMLGNAVVPQQATLLFEAIVEMDERMQYELSGFP